MPGQRQNVSIELLPNADKLISTESFAHCFLSIYNATDLLCRIVIRGLLLLPETNLEVNHLKMEVDQLNMDFMQKLNGIILCIGNSNLQLLVPFIIVQLVSLSLMTFDPYRDRYHSELPS